MSASSQISAILLWAKEPIALHDIQARILKSFGEMHETTAISARIRGDVRPNLARLGYAVKSKRKSKECAKHVYWVEAV